MVKIELDIYIFTLFSSVNTLSELGSHCFEDLCSQRVQVCLVSFEALLSWLRHQGTIISLEFGFETLELWVKFQLGTVLGFGLANFSLLFNTFRLVVCHLSWNIWGVIENIWLNSLKFLLSKVRVGEAQWALLFKIHDAAHQILGHRF